MLTQENQSRDQPRGPHIHCRTRLCTSPLDFAFVQTSKFSLLFELVSGFQLCSTKSVQTDTATLSYLTDVSSECTLKMEL